MSLPDLIEIAPSLWTGQVEITVPGSKSITNRALVLAALAEGETILRGALWSEDTQVMVDNLGHLGFDITLFPDPAEISNRTIQIQGLGGRIPKGGTPEKPLELFVGNAGTAARFLCALVCLGQGVYRLHGVPRMHERPQSALFEALRQLGYRIDSPNDRLPAVVYGAGRRPGLCWVNIAESSQFASALMLCAGAGGWDVELAGENEEETQALVQKVKTDATPGKALRRGESEGGYIGMTSKLIAAFPKKGGEFQIEPDASSGSYFWAAATQEIVDCVEQPAEDGGSRRSFTLSPPSVRVAHWPVSGWQIDARFNEVFQRITFGSTYFVQENAHLPEKYQGKWREDIEESLRRTRYDRPITWLPERPTQVPGSAPAEQRISRRTDLGDSIMTAIVMASLGVRPFTFTDLGRMRLQECERVGALRTELTKCGGTVLEEKDTLKVFPAKLHGAEIETYHDHRMAMCFAILGLKVPGIKIKNPACVKKTFPNFFQKLAAAPPEGLGAIIRDAATGQKLLPAELFAT